MCAPLHSIVPIIPELRAEGKHLYSFQVNSGLGGLGII
jgi:hypothetical protein